jgi:hypothetical protein
MAVQHCNTCAKREAIHGDRPKNWPQGWYWLIQKTSNPRGHETIGWYCSRQCLTNAINEPVEVEEVACDY